jgi:hypothetical protein
MDGWSPLRLHHKKYPSPPHPKKKVKKLLTTRRSYTIRRQAGAVRFPAERGFARTNQPAFLFVSEVAQLKTAWTVVATVHHHHHHHHHVRKTKREERYSQTRSRVCSEFATSVVSRHCSIILLLLLFLVAGLRRSYNTALTASCSNSTACN